jgi:putative aldouronate transport system permease protein
MKIKRSLGERTFSIFNNTFMVLLMIATLYPIWYVAVASISEGTEIMRYRGPLIKPLGFSLAAYDLVLKNPMVSRGYLNTLFVVFVGVAINILLTSLGAYFLSRKGVLWKKPIMFGIIFTMYFHGGLIPNYLNVKSLGLYNSLWALIIPGAISTFNMIIMRTAFAAIPDSLEESAKLDGASHFTILWRIIFPLAAPTVAVLVLYYGVSHWNAWYNAMVYLRDREKFPLQLILREILIQNSQSDTATSLIDEVKAGEIVKYAIIMVATLPILTIYPFLQKYFAKGVMVGAVKG